MRFLNRWLRRAGGTPKAAAPQSEPYADQFEALVREDWRAQVAQLQANCSHSTQHAFSPPIGETRVVCSDCGLAIAAHQDP
jgi:hypothetical protein